MRNFLNTIFFVIVIFLLGSIFGFYNVQAKTTNIGATVQIRVCGNGVIETGEQCDGSALGGQTCVSRGFTGGSLSCNSDCTFNTSSCTSGGGGGGGGGVYIPPTGETKVILQGKAYPGSIVNVLQDGRTITSTPADTMANFRVDIANITPGVWSFTLWTEDKEGRRSITLSFTSTILSGVTTTISGIFLPPSIDIDKTTLAKGDVLNIVGITVPQSTVAIHINSPSEIVKQVKTLADGTYFYALDTSPIEEGSHIVKSQATSLEGLLSTFSQALAFNLGGVGIKGCPGKADINGDKRINLVDFSILLYNWGIPKNKVADLNCDGKVNLVDFSIMLFYWTG